MCTLSFIPLQTGNVITANRDENPLRNATGLSPFRNRKDKEYLIAREPVFGGTNLAIELNGSLTTLLNGAFGQHSPEGEYRMSRGIMVLESLDFDDLFHFSREFDFEHIEPFTLVRFSDVIQEIRWDGNDITPSTHDLLTPHIWASPQLYAADAIEKRKVWFERFMKRNGTPGPDDIFDFHILAGDGDIKNDLVMNRDNMVRTVSITQVSTKTGIQNIRHFNLLEGSDVRIGLNNV